MSEQCTTRVYSSGMGGNACRNPAKVLDGTKWHCTTHSDAAQQRRNEARVARREADSARWKAQAVARREAEVKQAEIERRAECYEPMLAALEAFAEAFGPIKERPLGHGVEGTYFSPAGNMIQAEIAVQANAAIAAAKGLGPCPDCGEQDDHLHPDDHSAGRCRGCC